MKMLAIALSALFVWCEAASCVSAEVTAPKADRPLCLKLTREVPLGAFGGAELFFADLDRDGRPEVLAYQGPAVFGAKMYRGWPQVKPALPKSTCLVALRQDGTRLWTWGTPNPTDRPFTSHAHESCVAAGDVDGDGRVEVALADGRKIYLLDGLTGRVRAEAELPEDNFYIVQVLGQPVGPGEAAVVVKNGEGGYGHWRYGQPLLALDAQLKPAWGPGGDRRRRPSHPRHGSRRAEGQRVSGRLLRSEALGQDRLDGRRRRSGPRGPRPRARRFHRRVASGLGQDAAGYRRFQPVVPVRARRPHAVHPARPASAGLRFGPVSRRFRVPDGHLQLPTGPMVLYDPGWPRAVAAVHAAPMAAGLPQGVRGTRVPPQRADQAVFGAAVRQARRGLRDLQRRRLALGHGRPGSTSDWSSPRRPIPRQPERELPPKARADDLGYGFAHEDRRPGTPTARRRP